MPAAELLLKVPENATLSIGVVPPENSRCPGRVEFERELIEGADRLLKLIAWKLQSREALVAAVAWRERLDEWRRKDAGERVDDPPTPKETLDARGEPLAGLCDLLDEAFGAEAGRRTLKSSLNAGEAAEGWSARQIALDWIRRLNATPFASVDLADALLDYYFDSCTVCGQLMLTDGEQQALGEPVRCVCGQKPAPEWSWDSAGTLPVKAPPPDDRTATVDPPPADVPVVDTGALVDEGDPEEPW